MIALLIVYLLVVPAFLLSLARAAKDPIPAPRLMELKSYAAV